MISSSEMLCIKLSNLNFAKIFFVVYSGSKMDLKFEPDLKLHPIDQEEGRILADQCGAFFMEVSSRSGDGISDSVQLLAQELAKLEDKDLENAKNIVLKTKKKKSGCC